MPIRVGELDLDSFPKPEGEPRFYFEVFSYFETHGYPCDEITEAYSVVNEKDGENSGHLVVKLSTLSKPLDQADYVEDKAEIWACSCADYRYNRGVDLEEKPIVAWESCKHITEVIQ